jgi:hypothetical protein
MPDQYGEPLTVNDLVLRLERQRRDCEAHCVVERDAALAWRQRAEATVRLYLARLVERAEAELAREELEAG